MIKILFFIETLTGGGAEKVLCNLVNNMDKSKFDITVMTLFPVDSEKYLDKAVRYRSAYKSDNKLNRLLYRAEAEAGLVYPLRMKGDYDIEVAYLECGPTKIMASSTNKKAKKLAWVHTDLNAMPDNPKEFASRTIKYYKKYDRVVCMSRQALNSFRELYGEDIETALIYNTVNDKEIISKATETVDTDKNKFNVVSVGRLVEPKNYKRLLSAHKKLLDDGFDHNLLILGEGPDRKELEAYVKENGLEATVKMPGFVENPYPYIKNADLLACSSIYEGFSTFITEGLILGRPAVVTDVSGMRELLGDSEYGLVTENDDEAFYEGMKKMLSDKKLLNHYEEQARLRGKMFSTEDLVRATEKFFISLL